MDVKSLLPICFIILLGAILQKSRFINSAFVEKASDMMHLVLLPMVIFWTFADSSRTVKIGSEVYLAAILPAFVVLVIAHLYILFFESRIDEKEALVFSMGCYRSNLYLSLALIGYLFNKIIFYEFCIFLIIFIPLTDVMTLISSTLVLKTKRTKTETASLLFRLIYANPFVIAGILGLLLSKQYIPYPVFIDASLNFIIPSIFPLALILTGAMLCQVRIKSICRLTVAASILKTIILPVSGYSFIRIFSLNGEIMDAIIIFLSLPYMLERNFFLTTYNIRKEVMVPFYSFSTLCSIVGVSVALHLL